MRRDRALDAQRYTVEQRLQHSWYRQVEVVEILFKIDHGRPGFAHQVLDAPPPQIVDYLDVNATRSEAPDKIRSDHPCPTRNQNARIRQFRSLMRKSHAFKIAWIAEDHGGHMESMFANAETPRLEAGPFGLRLGLALGRRSNRYDRLSR